MQVGRSVALFAPSASCPPPPSMCALCVARPSPQRRRQLHTSRAAFATHADSAPNPLTFPSKPHPTPLDIFHLTRDDDLSPKAVKARYYELCRLYHPDLRKGKERSTGDDSSIDTSEELKQINLAYEVLRNPTKRDIYLRSGYGWGPGGRGGSGGNGPRPWNGSAGGYDFSRGRPMRDGGSYAWRGPYPSASWDWADPHNPHFRPGGSSGGGATAGWAGQGNVSSNGSVFLALCSLTLFLTPLTVWSATPSRADPGDESHGFVPMVADRRHRDAARALEQARREAKVGGQQKREAISRRVKEIERARAYERARELQMVEMQEKPTGHLQLSAPSSDR